MDEQTAVNLALDAYRALDSIGQDVAQLRDLGSKQLELLQNQPAEVPNPADDEAQALSAEADSADWVTEVHTSVEVPQTFFADLMGMQYMQVAASAFILVALLLNVGVNLFLAFFKHWR